MAYITVISATVIPGKVKEALEKTQAVADYWNQHYTGNVRIVESMDGPNGRYHWLHEYETQADQEAAGEQWENDPVGQEWGSVNHEFWTDQVTHRYRIL